MKTSWILLLAAVSLSIAVTVRSQEEAADAEELAEPPPIPPKVQNEQLEPSVTIRRDEEENVIEEYSLDGRVYMVKVTPKNGIPYYYLDDDGDGQLELRESDRAAYPVKPVYWKIKEWK